MRVLGLLGGMSWESSVEYERLINQAVREQLGGANSADLIVRSFNFADIEKLQANGNWEAAGQLLSDAAQKLEAAGAEGIVLCTNTMHVLAEEIARSVSIPLIHIADATGEAITRSGISRVLLLGTRYTMEKDFYKSRLKDRFGLEVSTPSEDQRAEIHRIIYHELVRGIVNDHSRSFFLNVVDEFRDAGVQGVIAGCTEIELLVKPEHVEVAYFPTTKIHSDAAAAFALR